MSKLKIIADNGSSLVIKPTYGLAMKIATKTGAYKWTRWLSILFFGATATIAVLWSQQKIGGMGTGLAFAMFILTAIGMCLIFIKPSQILVNNEGITVDRKKFDEAVANGTEITLFRQWY